MTTKISVSLPHEDIAVLDALVAGGVASGRSAAIRVAIDRVRDSVLEMQLAEQLLAAFDDQTNRQTVEEWDGTAKAEL